MVLSKPLSLIRGSNCCRVPGSLKYASKHWGDFFCYHDQKSSWYIVFVWFEIFKKLDDAGVEVVMDSIDWMLLWPISGMFERFSLV